MVKIVQTTTEHTMVLWQIVLLAFLWPLSFWYLLQFEKAFIELTINSDSPMVVIVAIFTPVIALWFILNRWLGWSLE